MERLNALRVVFAKEVLDNARDRRSLLVALIYPLMGPLLLGLIVSMVTTVITMGSQPIQKLHMVGAAHAPALVAFLAEKTIVPEDPGGDPEDLVRSGKLGAVIVVPESFSRHFDAGETAPLSVVVNTAHLPGLVALNRVANLLAEFNSTIWTRRIAQHGVDIGVLRPLAIDTVNVAMRNDTVHVLLLMVAPLFIFNVFMGGVYITIDITSGERERDSLEPLLINPLDRWVLMLGKFLAALFFTGVAVAVQLTAFKAAFMIAGGAGSVVSATLTPGVLIGIFLMAVPLMMVAVGVQFVIATITRSLKEAQTYLGFLPLVPALPGMLIVFAPVEVREWMMAVPAFSQTLLLGQIVRGQTVAMADVALASGATTAFAILLLALLARLYESEKMVF